MSVTVGSIVEGVVTGLAKFGAFVELPDKKVGLVHISGWRMNTSATSMSI